MPAPPRAGAARRKPTRRRPCDEPARLSYELRHAESDALQRRRWIVGLSLFGAAMGALMLLYQVRILPEAISAARTLAGRR